MGENAKDGCAGAGEECNEVRKIKQPSKLDEKFIICAKIEFEKFGRLRKAHENGAAWRS